MSAVKETYLDVTPIDLWRLGVKNSPRLNKLRVPPRPPGASVDIRTEEINGIVWVKAGSGGISTFDGINPRLKGGHWWKIPANTTLPSGLKITKNHKDHATALTHYRIEPEHDMPLSKFVLLLSSLATSATRQFQDSGAKEKV